MDKRPDDQEALSPLIPDADILQGPDHGSRAALKAGSTSEAALTRGWEAVVGDNKLAFLADGPERLSGVIELIDGAQSSLKLLYYMFRNDGTGHQVMDRLVAALERGVKVTLIIDSFGSSDTPDRFFERFRKSGGDYRVFSTKWRATYLIRNHQKLIIADDHHLITGGFNIADDYFGPIIDRKAWQDLGVSITGPATAPMVQYYDKISRWVADPAGNWKSLRLLIHSWDRNDPKSQQQGALHWYVGGPTRRLNPLVKAIKADLERGQRFDMIQAYFAPGRGMLRRIARIASERKGATLVLPAKSDNGATIGAARILYGYLLKRSVKIYEFAPCKLHTKLIVIDDAVYVGSANFDMRSLYINMELMLRVEDTGLAERARAFIAVHADHSDVITQLEHKRQLTPLNRMRWSLAYFLVAVMDYGITRRLNFGIAG